MGKNTLWQRFIFSLWPVVTCAAYRAGIEREFMRRFINDLS